MGDPARKTKGIVTNRAAIVKIGQETRQKNVKNRRARGCELSQL
jgi:hypothetical protein